jgi:hypothetical protein
MQRSQRTSLTLRARRSQRRNRIPGSSPAAVPPSVPFTTVSTGLQRTTTDNAKASSTCTVFSRRRSPTWPIWLGSRGSVGRGLHRPCRARPADRSLVAEDRSAAGVRDRTEPDLGPCWVRGAPGPHGHERSPTVTSSEEKQQVGRLTAQAARTTPASGSDCGTEGRWRRSLSLQPGPSTVDVAASPPTERPRP